MEASKSERQRIIRRHRHEKKELQAHIQAMKNDIPRSDKKRRKQMLLEVARLEAEIERKHQQEIQGFDQSPAGPADVDTITEDLAKMDLENQPPFVSRAQRRRERKAAIERERRERIRVQERERTASYGREEEAKLATILLAKNLEMKYIPADGHCMYRAVQHQLPVFVTVASLRRSTAEYMQHHVDEFLPFFSNPDGHTCTRKDFLKYCEDIDRCASWGTQIELRALSHILQTPIEVIQADSPIITIGEEYNKKPLILVYLRYACDIGEHYNSVRSIEVKGTEAEGAKAKGAEAEGAGVESTDALGDEAAGAAAADDAAAMMPRYF
ncbi:OTU domain-containing protein 6A [Ochotona princeps]|uniref:OTU domain-containing protein 6A n=1 Tax=Ochotona princeps TaxID=9978 RepID=UPI002714EAD0|nr:OTU domain-containing protein 6A [Ochotona princeps]